MVPFWNLTMATITLKNVPDELYERLKKSAAENRRSINSEAITCLERMLRIPAVDPKTFLAEVRAMRRRMKGVWVTDESLNAAKRQGRP